MRTSRSAGLRANEQVRCAPTCTRCTRVLRPRFGKKHLVELLLALGETIRETTLRRCGPERRREREREGESERGRRKREREGGREGAGRARDGQRAVSYTHLTLPTICSV
eukprot:1691331-Rhodomonas_salina.1